MVENDRFICETWLGENGSNTWRDSYSLITKKELKNLIKLKISRQTFKNIKFKDFMITIPNQTTIFCMINIFRSPCISIYT